jgi:multimeric flavodoxin WrbA
MQILGIYGGQDASGLTATVVKEILGAVQAPATTAFLDLNDFDLHPESPQRPNPDLDQLAAKLQAADIWVFGAPTYYTTIPGQLK